MARSRILEHSRADGRPLRSADDSSVLFSSTDWPDVKVERQVLPPTSMGEQAFRRVLGESPTGYRRRLQPQESARQQQFSLDRPPTVSVG